MLIINHHVQVSDTLPESVAYYATKVKHLRYTGDISRKDISKMTSFCETKSPFPNLRHLEVMCWPLSLTECSFLFGPMLERLTLVGLPPTSEPLARRGGQGPWSNRQYQRICIYQLIKKSPHLKSIHSLVQYGIDGSRESTMLPFFLANDATANERKSRPGWLGKIMRIERFCDSHLDACKRRIEDFRRRHFYRMSWIILTMKSTRHVYGKCIFYVSGTFPDLP